MSAQAVERCPMSDIPEGRELRPHRQFSRNPTPIGTASPYEDMTPIALAAANRIRANRKGLSVGSYLFGSPTGQVYVIREDTTCCARMFVDHQDWLAGVFASDTSDGKRAVCPDESVIFDCLRQHFVDIGLVTDAHLYEAVRLREG